MATTLPPYTPTEEAPPSYEQAIKKLTALVGENPTAEKVLNGGQKLSTAELEVLARNHSEHYPLQTDKEKYHFVVGLCLASSSDGVKAYLEAGAHQAVAAAEEVERIFSSLDRKIAEIDLIHQSNFRPTLLGIQKKYRQVLDDSQTLATKISVSAQDFDDILVKFWGNREYSIHERKEGVDAHLKSCESFKKQTQAIQAANKQLINDFSTLVKSFSHWAKGKEGELTEAIKKLDKELEDLQEKYAALMAAATGLGTGTGIILGVAGVLIAAFPVWSTVLVIAGLIAAVVGFGTTVGLIVWATRIQDEILEKTAEKEELEQQLEEIRRAHQELEKEGEASLASFTRCLTIMSSFWNATIEDAGEIKLWLESGAREGDRPQYLKLNRDMGVRSYNAMGDYLRIYAKGIRKWRRGVDSSNA